MLSAAAGQTGSLAGSSVISFLMLSQIARADGGHLPKYILVVAVSAVGIAALRAAAVTTLLLGQRKASVTPGDLRLVMLSSLALSIALALFTYVLLSKMPVLAATAAVWTFAWSGSEVLRSIAVLFGHPLIFWCGLAAHVAAGAAIFLLTPGGLAAGYGSFGAAALLAWASAYASLRRASRFGDSGSGLRRLQLRGSALIAGETLITALISVSVPLSLASLQPRAAVAFQLAAQVTATPAGYLCSGVSIVLTKVSVNAQRSVRQDRLLLAQWLGIFVVVFTAATAVASSPPAGRLFRALFGEAWELTTGMLYVPAILTFCAFSLSVLTVLARRFKNGQEVFWLGVTGSLVLNGTVAIPGALFGTTGLQWAALALLVVAPLAAAVAFPLFGVRITQPSDDTARAVEDQVKGSAGTAP